MIFSPGYVSLLLFTQSSALMFDHYYHEAVDLLKTLIGIPAVSREENERATFLQHWLAERDWEVQRVFNNLWCQAPDYRPEKPTLLLNSHLDTVKPVNGWTKEPFKPVQEEDQLFGLGSNDAGASLCSLIQVFRILSSRPQPYNLVLGITAEEEITGKLGIEALLPELPPINLGLVGEPTNMHPAVAEKGLLVLDAVVHGKAGHAARNEGVNAIYKALPAIEWFKNTTFPLQSNLLGPVKMTVTQIQAGTQHNVVPDECRLVIDIRINEFYTPEKLFELIAASVPCEVNARSFRLNSSSIELDHPVIKACLQAGRVPYGSPTLSDQARMPFKTFKMGPGESARSHTADEYVYLQEIEKAIELYVKVLDGISWV
jgi:acetylornithine deacetylase